jgi:hypothetical protein
MKYKTEILKTQIPLSVLSNLKTIVENDVSTYQKNQPVGAPHGTYYPVGEVAHDIVRDNLPLIENERLYVSFLQHSQPTGPHTDTNISPGDTYSDPKRFARTFIIPLETQDTHTITFNECMDHGSVGSQMNQFMSSLPERNLMSVEVYNKYLSWKTSEMMYYYSRLSVETIFPWIAGDVLVFDRKRMHTGDNHLDKMPVKKGIIVWSEIVC